MNPVASTVWILTGPLGAGKTRWLGRELVRRHRVAPDSRCAVLLTEQGRTRADELRRSLPPAIELAEIRLGCLCCQPGARVAEALALLMDRASCRDAFVEVPALAACAVAAEISRLNSADCRRIVCLNHAWRQARQSHRLAFFQLRLLAHADIVIADGSDLAAGASAPAIASRRDSPALLTLS